MLKGWVKMYEPKIHIFEKVVDWSVLHYGFNIPMTFQDSFCEKIGIEIGKGESIKVKLFYCGNMTVGTLYRLRPKKSNLKGDLQIRYQPNSAIAEMFQDVFCKSYNYLQCERSLIGNVRKGLSIPENEKEYISIHSTIFNEAVYIECIPMKNWLNRQNRI